MILCLLGHIFVAAAGRSIIDVFIVAAVVSIAVVIVAAVVGIAVIIVDTVVSPIGTAIVAVLTAVLHQ